MQSVLIAFLVAGFTFGGALAGMWLRTRLPDHHVDPDSKDVVKIAMGLIATMTALILGLVVSSAKAEFDAEDDAVTQSAAQILELDRVLDRYGPETKGIRALIKAALKTRIVRMWPESGARMQTLEGAADGHAIEAVLEQILMLTPATDVQKYLQSQALQQIGSLQQNRWIMLERETVSLAEPFLIAIVCWLTLIFGSFGLFAPRHATSVLTLGVSAISVAAAIFLITEMEHPYTGLIAISPAPLEFALSHL